MYPPWIYSMTNRKLADTKTRTWLVARVKTRRTGREDSKKKKKQWKWWNWLWCPRFSFSCFSQQHLMPISHLVRCFTASLKAAPTATAPWPLKNSGLIRRLITTLHLYLSLPLSFFLLILMFFLKSKYGFPV